MMPESRDMSRSDLRGAGLCAAATILCLAILAWGRFPLLDFAAALPLAFYLPGYAVMRALGVEFEGQLESLVLRMTLSLAIVIIAGLALNFSYSIERPGWLAALGVIILSANVLDFATNRRGAANTSPSPATGPRHRFRAVEIVTLACALGFAAASFALSTVFVIRYHEFDYTELWVLPKTDSPGTVVVGLHNAEGKAQNYLVELLVDHHFVQSWSDISLKPGESWTTEFRWIGYGIYPRPVTPLQTSASAKQTPAAIVSERAGLGATPRVEALVYRSNQPSVVYRHAWTARDCVTEDDPHGRPPCEY
jgi:uncharacterized membrane protein